MPGRVNVVRVLECEGRVRGPANPHCVQNFRTNRDVDSNDAEVPNGVVGVGVRREDVLNRVTVEDELGSDLSDLDWVGAY